jgi:hypothetical protein
MFFHVVKIHLFVKLKRCLQKALVDFGLFKKQLLKFDDSKYREASPTMDGHDLSLLLTMAKILCLLSIVRLGTNVAIAHHIPSQTIESHFCL